MFTAPVNKAMANAADMLNGYRYTLFDVISVATFANALLWVSLIFFTRYNAPQAGFTFMFQFLHFTSYVVNAGGLSTLKGVAVTVLFLLIDTSALLWLLIDPILEPWSAFHILATVNSAIFLLLGLTQAFLFWVPFATEFFRARRRSLLR